jgi:hypothetical protein
MTTRDPISTTRRDGLSEERELPKSLNALQAPDRPCHVSPRPIPSNTLHIIRHRVLHCQESTFQAYTIYLRPASSYVHLHTFPHSADSGTVATSCGLDYETKTSPDRVRADYTVHGNQGNGAISAVHANYRATAQSTSYQYINIMYPCVLLALVMMDPDSDPHTTLSESHAVKHHNDVAYQAA